MAIKFNPELSDISEEGLKIRKAYVGQMRMQKHNPTYGNYLMARYDGGTDDDGREYSTNVWDKLVAVFNVNELDTYEYVEFAFSNGLVNGKDSNMFDPKGNTTRAETAAVFCRLIFK